MTRRFGGANRKIGGMRPGKEHIVNYALYHDISRYLKRSGTSPATFGRAAVNDPRLVFDLRDGRRPGPRIAARVYRYISQREGRPGQCG